MDIAFTVSSLCRFSSKPREGHLKRAIKTLGYLKKYLKEGYLINPRPPIENIKYVDVKPNFGNQYDFKEEIDKKLPQSRMNKPDNTIFVNSNHGYDSLTGKYITRAFLFVERIPIKCFSEKAGISANIDF